MYDPTQSPQPKPAVDPTQLAQPQPAQDQPTQAPQSAAPAPSAPITASAPPPSATSKNPHMHRFIASVLGALAGPAPTEYTTDANGKVVAAPAAPESASQKVARITNNALVGLKASATAPQQKSGLANLLAGAGLGAGAVSEQHNAANDANKQKAREDFEAEQQATLRKYELAKGNAVLYSTYKHLHDEDIDRNEEYKVNSDLAKAFEDEKIPLRRMSGDQLTKEFNESPQRLLTEGRVLLTGEKAATDSDGNPIVDPATQQPRYERQYAVVDGMKDGKIALPASFIDYANKYLPYSSVKVANYEHLEAGQPVDAKDFYRLHNAALDGMKQSLAGWAKPDAVENADGAILQKNPVTGETKPATEEQASAYKMRKAKLAETESITKKNLAEANKANKDGSNSAASPADQALVTQVGTGRSDLPNPRTKEGSRIAALVAEAYPDYDQTKGQTWSKSRNEYMGSGQTAKKVVSYNTALEHMKDLYDHSTFNGLYVPGSKDYSDRSVALNYVANEVGTAIKNGVMAQKEGEEILDSLKGWTPGTAKERTAETARLLHDKIDEYQRKFDESKPSSAIQVPILMSPKAGAAYDYVQSGGKLQSQQGAQQPPAQTAGHKVGDQIVQNGKTFTVTSVDDNGKVTGAK